VRSIFARISSNLPEKFVFGKDSPYKFSVTKLVETFFQRSHSHIITSFFVNKKRNDVWLQRKGLHFSYLEKNAKFRHISSSHSRERSCRIHHTMRTKVSKHLCPNFPGFCPDFWQIKTFGGAFSPPPPTPQILRNVRKISI